MSGGGRLAGSGLGALATVNAVERLREIWTEAIGTQVAPATTSIWLSAALALAVVLFPTTWRVARHAVTIAHEGSHGVAALLSGRRLAGIRLHSDSSGLTLSKGKPRGIGMVVTAAAGYTGPSLLGLLAAWLLSRGHALGVLWLAVALLALLLLQIRNFHGLWAVLVAGGLVFAVSWWGTDRVQSLTAYAGTWFLLIATPATVLELQRERRGARARSSDADVLARLTHVPGLVWVGVFLLVDLGALALGGRLLLT